MENAFSFWNSRKTFFVVVTFAVLVFIYQIISSPMVITVSGVGEASAPATNATLTFSVSLTGDNSASALSNVKARASKIRETLKVNGIVESDIYESQATVYPTSAVTANASGYTATMSMGIKTTQIPRLDVLISTIYSQGASVVTQPVLSAGEDNKLETSAFQLALIDANNKATKIGLKNLKFIKKAVLVQENSNSQGGSVTSNLDGAGVLKVSKVLLVSYKLW